MSVIGFLFYASQMPEDKSAVDLGGPFALVRSYSPYLSTYAITNEEMDDEDNASFSTYIGHTHILAYQNPLSFESSRNGIITYKIKQGDTLSKIAFQFDISLRTILWANPALDSNQLKPNQEIVILPTDGVLHEIASNETINSLAQLYNISEDSIVRWNKNVNLRSLLAGTILVIPGGTPKQKPVNTKVDLAGLFIPPVDLKQPGTYNWGKLHPQNAVDIAAPCIGKKSQVYAVADGLVIDAKHGWNGGYGNYIDILHDINDTTIITRYSHVDKILIQPDTYINSGDLIAFVGNTGNTHGPTGCHVHFEVYGAKNPFVK